MGRKNKIVGRFTRGRIRTPSNYTEEAMPTPPKTEKKPLIALNTRQEIYIAAIRSSEQVFCLGPAGTGKTYIAASLAAEAYESKNITKIILTRPAVGVDEEHGFLKGSLDDKIAPWVVPFTEVLEERLGREQYRYARKMGHIQIVPLAFMRGRTFHDAFVILDEAQNTTIGQMKMFLTRIGENAKVLVNGDVEQSDFDSENGLAYTLDMIDALRLNVPVVEFTAEDVVRSGVCRMWAEAFTDYADPN